MRGLKRWLRRCPCKLQRVVALILVFAGSSSVVQWIFQSPNKATVSTMNEQETAIEKPAVKVITVSYYRSGTSFLSSMFDLNPSAFFWFDPLAATTFKWGWVYDQVPPRSFYHYDNGTERLIPLEDLRQNFLFPIRAIFSCNLSVLPHEFFTHRVNKIAHVSKMTMTRYHLCTERYRNFTQLRSRIEHCLPKLQSYCSRANIVAIKTIRLRMKLVAELLETDPTIRIIYMVRDPRGMLNSWWNNTRISRRSYSEIERSADARVMCTRILSDWREFVEIRKKYPQNCFWLRYEDLAKSTETVTAGIYRFLGVPLVPRDVVAGMRDLGRSTNGNFGVYRVNSSITATQWMTSMPMEHQRIVTENCLELFHEEELGFDLSAIN